MFERYTESARRVLFFARYETTATGARSIDSEHLLLGLARDPGPIVRRLFAGADIRLQELRQEVENRNALRERVAMSVEIPFSQQSKRILIYTAEEAESLGHSDIGTCHILLALLRVPESTAGAILTGRGLRLQTARDAVVAMLAEGVPPASSRAVKDAPESGTARRAAPVSEPPGPGVDTEGMVSDIARIERLVEQILRILPPHSKSAELLHLLHVEVLTLRGRLS